MPSSFLLRISTVFLLAASFVIAEDTHFADKPPFSASAKEMIAEANRSTPGKGDDVVVLLDEDRWIFDKNGDMRQSMHLVFQVVTAQGVEDWSNLQWRWEPWHEKRPTIRARVVTADGVVHMLDQNTVVDASASAQDNNVYSDVRAVKCPLPAMAMGAVVEEEVEVSSTHLLTGTLGQAYFGRNEPVRLARVYFEYPDELQWGPIKFASVFHVQKDQVTADFSFDSGKRRPDKTAGMQQAMSNSPSPGMLHTLAAMYAEEGKSTEARETILAAMRMWGLDEPDSLSWLIFGRLAEQFGVKDEAATDYARVGDQANSVENDSNSPYSAWALAQRRLAVIKK